MIKLILEIKETENKKLDNISAVGCEIGIKEVSIFATDGEKEISDILKKRIKINKRLQFEFDESLKEKLNRLSEFDI